MLLWNISLTASQSALTGGVASWQALNETGNAIISIWTATMTNSIPISRSIAINPRSPSTRYRNVEERRMAALIAQVIAGTSSKVTVDDGTVRCRRSSVASVDAPRGTERRI